MIFEKGKAVKCRNAGFTIIELLTVIAMIAVLMGILIPASMMVRNTAKAAKQRAQLMTIGLGLTAFQNDYGDYLASEDTANNYTGAERLAEALLGRDLLGFNPNTDWDTTIDTYYPLSPTVAELGVRKDSYIELGSANAFKLNDLFSATGLLNGNRYVICDVYKAKKVTLPPVIAGDPGITQKAGTPILYYKANITSKTIEAGASNLDQNIYNGYDNTNLVDLNKMTDSTRAHDLVDDGDGNFDEFYNYITDPKVSTATLKWPYRPDSYILISAGVDGLYGTSDDITNFGN